MSKHIYSLFSKCYRDGYRVTTQRAMQSLARVTQREISCWLSTLPCWAWREQLSFWGDKVDYDALKTATVDGVARWGVYLADCWGITLTRVDAILTLDGAVLTIRYAWDYGEGAWTVLYDRRDRFNLAMWRALRELVYTEFGKQARNF